MLTEQDFQRLEKKIDFIIEHIKNADIKKPIERPCDIEREARASVLKFVERRRKKGL